MRIFVGDESFAKYDETALNMLKDARMIEEFGTRDEAEGIIAGIEIYNEEVLKTIPNLKIIARMGVGYDTVDIDYCKKHNIMVTYTPEAPAGSVAELTIAQMLNLIRSLPRNNEEVKKGWWNKYLGKKLSEMTIGVIGVGRIGQRVIKRLQPFTPKEILAYDIDALKVEKFWIEGGCTFTDCLNIKTLIRDSDIITVHIPMNACNENYLNRNFFKAMKDGSYLINTSRGGILNEQDLYETLFHHSHKLVGAALDVFFEEPYNGPLVKFNNLLMTPHIGSLTLEARIAMETGAVKDCINFLNYGEPINPIPEMEMIDEPLEN